jgi:hypothetical protein
MEHYRKYSEFTQLMTHWVGAIVRSGQFLQQMDPETGVFSPDRGAYSPTMLTLFDFTWRLYGVRPGAAEIEWNCRLPEGAGTVRATWGSAQIEQDRSGTKLKLDGKTIAQVKGSARVVTSPSGQALRLVATEPRTMSVEFQAGGKPPRTFALEPNRVVNL